MSAEVARPSLVIRSTPFNSSCRCGNTRGVFILPYAVSCAFCSGAFPKSQTYISPQPKVHLCSIYLSYLKSGRKSAAFSYIHARSLPLRRVTSGMQLMRRLPRSMRYFFAVKNSLLNPKITLPSAITGYKAFARSSISASNALPSSSLS